MLITFFITVFVGWAKRSAELSPRIFSSIIPLSQNAFFLGEGQGVRV